MRCIQLPVANVNGGLAKPLLNWDRVSNYTPYRITEVIIYPCPNPLHWRHNEKDGVSDHQTHDYLLNRLFMRRSRETSKPRVTDLCAGNSPVTGEFPAQRASNTENVSIWWRHHAQLTHASNKKPQKGYTLHIAFDILTDS